MKCPFCETKMMPDDPNIDEHLVVLRIRDGGGQDHFHVHGPIDNKSEILDMIQFVAKEAGIETSVEARPGR